MLAALIFSAAMAAEPAAAVKAQPFSAQLPRVCRDNAGVQQAQRGKPTLLPTRKSKLGALPKPDMELTVERRINGCVSPLRTRLQVQGDGRFANPNFQADAPASGDAPALPPVRAEAADAED